MGVSSTHTAQMDDSESEEETRGVKTKVQDTGREKKECV